ncbi:MAG: transporter ATP-binding protein [Phycisphaerales bacterium]|nr:transporter ATP-binding protein [Phycisphaerales bacterium]
MTKGDENSSKFRVGVRFYARVLSYFTPDWPFVLLTLSFILLSTLAALLQPFPLAILIDSIEVKQPSNHWAYRLFLSITPESTLGRIIALAVATLVLRLLQELFTMGKALANIRVGYSGLMRARCDLFDKLQQLSLAYFKAQPQGDAIYRLSTDVYGFQTTLNNLINAVVVSLVTLVAMAWIMFSMNWRLTLLALTVTPALVWAHRYFHGVLKRKWTDVKQIDTELTTTIQRSVATMGLVQAFGQEEREYDKFERNVRSSISKYVRTHLSEIAYGLVVGLILGIGSALIFGYGGFLVYRDQIQNHVGEDGMTVGKLLVFITYLAQLYGPLSNLTAAGASMTQGVVGCQRVFEVLDRDAVIFDAPNARPLAKQPRVLVLENLTFEYLEGTPILRAISATISPGQMVAFVGSSGVGKSTMLSLLPRFYDPTGGAIELDGQDIRGVRIKDLRRHIALVLQENVILPASVSENIAYGRPDATDEQIRHAAKLAEADTFIRALPQGYATEINESGANLSGGQRQRIAIARALITEAPIMILDEPTSALDPNNERAITQTLNSLKGQRTIILVSHRLSTVIECDQIFMMEHGQIIERGTHDELVARRGAYYEMARHQLQLDESESPAAAVPQG